MISAEFVISCAGLRQLPQASMPEVAFAGRSNVGKSSLMNSILDRKSLVKTGKAPGKTRLLNYFDINQKLYFVDLPGYGYAAVSRKERENWGKLMSGYFAVRQNLTMCLVLSDIRRDLREEEFSLLELLRQNNISSLLVLTKSDKLSSNQLMNRKREIAVQAGVDINELVHFSQITGAGKDRVREAICLGTGIDWY